jgi:hypothetical protein
MKAILTVVMLLLTGSSAFAHRLDEYLEATLITIEKDRIQAQMRLTPGIVVLPLVLATIDTDADGVISRGEQTAYADRVLRDLSLTIDGERSRLRVVSSKFPTVDEMKEGLGEIQIEFEASAPPGGTHRRLVFENHHQSRIGAYLVNSLIPRDPDIRISAQNRDYWQSFYQLDYEQAVARPGALSFAGGSYWLGAVALLLSARLVFLRRQRIRRQDSIPGHAAVGNR